MKFLAPLRDSPAWYLSTMSIVVLLERYARYIWEEQPLVWGQSPNILLVFIGFGFSSAFWIVLKPGIRAQGWLQIFLAMMSAAWVVHLVLYRYHGDAFNYTALLYVPMLLMLYFKPPDSRSIKIAALVFAWATAVVLTLTRILEMAGLLEVKSQPQGIIEFDEERYFLPLNDLLGIDGRWPGPFGHNGDTAMMGALLVIVAVAFWSRGSWFLVVVGGLTLVLTNGRASIGAAAAGLLLLVMFSQNPRLQRFPRGLRIGGGSVLLLAGALIMFARPAGLTGREKIWPAFLELWAQSPVLGVGGSGIAEGNEVAQFYGHAHSLYIDELARWGLAGFVAQFAAIGVGLFIAARAAGFGFPGPLAVIVTYLVTGVTEPRNNWIAPSATGFLLVLMVLSAAAYLQHRPDGRKRLEDATSEEVSPLAGNTDNEAEPDEASNSC